MGVDSIVLTTPHHDSSSCGRLLLMLGRPDPHCLPQIGALLTTKQITHGTVPLLG